MLLLKNVKIVAPLSDLDGQISDILINKMGQVEKIGTHLSASKSTTVFEKDGTCVSAGWLDVGVNTSDPGFEHREDLASTARAAMAGGFTGVAPFPNTNPPIQSKTEILYIKNKTQTYLVDFYPIGAVSEDIKGKNIAEMVDMHHAGAVAFSDGQKPLGDAGLLLRGVQYAQIFDGLVFNFPFDKTLAPHGQMHEGLTSTSLGLPAIPSLAEELMVQRDLQLLQYADARLHFHNISTARSCDFIRNAKKQGLKVTASVAALNLCFDDTALGSFNTNFKVMPPLREKSDIEALIKALKDGTIDFINSNHTPIDSEGKDLEFPYADFGAIGLETAFALTNHFLHKKLTVNQLVEKFALNSRQILGLKTPDFTEGGLANFTLFNPDKEWVFSEKDIFSKSKNTPLVGHILRGVVEGVVNKGQFWLRNS
jgi:dihydroorotase